MARLQRKKASSSKKKKKQGVGITASPRIKNDADSKKTVLFTGSVSVEDIKKRQVSSPRRLSSGVIPEQGKLGNYLNKGIDFLREVKVELKKVTWPTRKQTVGSTVVMIILVIIISFFLGAVDIGLSSIIKVFLQ